MSTEKEIVPINSLTDLRDNLCTVFDKVADGTMSREKAKDLINAGGKIIDTVKVELVNAELQKVPPKIPFLERRTKLPTPTTPKQIYNALETNTDSSTLTNQQSLTEATKKIHMMLGDLEKKSIDMETMEYVQNLKGRGTYLDATHHAVKMLWDKYCKK